MHILSLQPANCLLVKKSHLKSTASSCKSDIPLIMRGDNKGIRYLRAHLDVSSSVGLLASGLPLQDGLPVGVELQVGDDDVGRVDTDLDGGTVGLVGGDSLNVDDPLLSVDLRESTKAILSTGYGLIRSSRGVSSPGRPCPPCPCSCLGRSRPRRPFGWAWIGPAEETSRTNKSVVVLSSTRRFDRGQGPGRSHTSPRPNTALLRPTLARPPSNRTRSTLTECFSLNSLFNPELIIFLLTEEGAEKWAFRLLRRS